MKYSNKKKIPQSIAVVGCSHLGIVWSVGYGSFGYQVTAFDTDENAVRALREGRLPVPEPGLPELFKKARSNITFTNDPSLLRECSVVFFAKDVPMDEEGRIDLTSINSLLDSVIPHLADEADFIFMGQVPVGFTRSLRAKILERRANAKIALTYCVETLTIGTAVEWFLKPDRIVLGTETAATTLSLRLVAVFTPFNCRLMQISYESAELTKSAINVYLATAVTWVNTIADLCEKLGANINEVVSVMKLDRRFSPHCYWRPGLGFAGGHLERDLATLLMLSEAHGIQPRFLQAIVEQSKERYLWLVRALEEIVFEKLTKPTLCLWGLAYKKGTDSLHNAQSLKVIRDFGSRATLHVYDPVAKLPPNLQDAVQVFPDKYEAVKGVNCLVILTEWEEFSVNDAKQLVRMMKHPIIIDCVNMLGPEARSSKTLTYVGMGIPRPAFGGF